MPDSRFASLTPLFAPRSVAVLGASSDPTRISGRPIAYMKAQGYQGALYPINPNRAEVQGLKAYASVADLPEAPDVAIVATGSTPRRDGFQTWRPGSPLDLSAGLQVVTAWDVLQGAEVGQSVAILDELGHYESIDVAEFLVESGRAVHHVTRFGLLGANLEMRWDIIGAPHLARLMRGDFTLYTRSMIVDVGPDSISVAPVDAAQSTVPIRVDTLVLMSGQVPDRTLQIDLEDAPFEVRVIGDASSPRLLQAAITEGQFAIRSLEPDWVRPKGLRYGITGSAI